MTTKSSFFTSTLAAAAVLSVTSAHAGLTLVSTIDGGYDGPTYDTPYLVISNSTAYSFSNISMLLTGYQDANNGITQTVSLSDIAPMTSQSVVWTGSTTPGNLFAYDYDDEYGQTTMNPLCVQPFAICSFVGNFKVTITATWNNPSYGMMGTEISSNFTPASNASGGFVGFEGLNPAGLSESTYDDHVNSPHGVLANIYVGPPVALGTPEPGTWVMLLLGFGAVGGAVRGRAKATLTA